MKSVIFFNEVKMFALQGEIIYYISNKRLYRGTIFEILEYPAFNAHFILRYLDKILCVDDNYTRLLSFDNVENNVIGWYALDSAIIGKDYLIITKKEQTFRKRLLMNQNINIVAELSTWPITSIFGNQLLQSDYPNTVKCFDFNSSLLWQRDLSQIGPYIKMDDTVADANEIGGELMGSEEFGLIYVPMAGGQLVALDAGTGEVRWVTSTGWNGRYDIFADYIYKVSDKLYKIDSKSGSLIMQRSIEDIFNSDFVPSGPLWAYSDLLILLDTRGATVLMVDLQSLTYKNHIHIEGVPGIAHSKTVVSWHQNKLYVLDMNRTLHVYEP